MWTLTEHSESPSTSLLCGEFSSRTNCSTPLPATWSQKINKNQKKNITLKKKTARKNHSGDFDMENWLSPGNKCEFRGGQWTNEGDSCFQSTGEKPRYISHSGKTGFAINIVNKKEKVRGEPKKVKTQEGTTQNFFQRISKRDCDLKAIWVLELSKSYTCTKADFFFFSFDSNGLTSVNGFWLVLKKK